MRFPLPSLAVIAAVPLIASLAVALEPDKDGWFHTGSGVREKSVAFVHVKAYTIDHWVKKLPDKKSKQAVIDLDADKRVAFTMLRDVGEGKIKGMFRDAFEDNGYNNKAKIDAFVGAFTKELTKGTRTTIVYDSTAKTTTVTMQGGGTATVQGTDFMRATWSVWFGKTDQPALGDALIAKL